MDAMNGRVKNYLDYCALEKKLDQKTLRAYRCDLEQFFAWLAEKGKGFDKEALRAYIVYLNTRYAASSAKRKLASIKSYAFYFEENEGQQNPFHGLRISIKEPKRLPRTIPIESLSELFTTLYAGGSAVCKTPYAQFRTARDRVIFELLIATGLRVSELCMLDNGSLSPSNKTVRIMGKGSKERVIQIENENTIEALEAYKQKTTAIWPEWGQKRHIPLILNRFGGRISDQSIRSIIKHWAKAAGLSEDITPHMFRHTFATLLLENDVDIRYIQRFLGHSSIQTTEIYTHVASSKMRDILKTSNPRSCLYIAR